VNPATEATIQFSRALCHRLRAAAAAEPTREVGVGGGDEQAIGGFLARHDAL
jgi:hypothetical protein